MLIDFLRIRRTQEVLSTLNNLQLGIRRVGKEFNLFFGICDRVNSIASSLC
jgi:hypothetical protein